MIPFLDLQKINARFEDQFNQVFQEFLDSGWYILGERVDTFEKEFGAYCGTDHCVGTGNGLDALRCILEGYKQLDKLKLGDEVLVASNTFIATILAIEQAGLVPVLSETEPEHYNFDLHNLEDQISPKTKVIMPVHLYGKLAPMAGINQIAERHDLLVIEDAAQAHGAMDPQGRRAGNLGDAAAFSFYPVKNLGALGDGGAITTNDSELAEIVAQIRNYGASTKYVNEVPGFNSRLDEIQAALLSCKLKRLDADNEKRREIARRYLSEVNNEKIDLPAYDGGLNHVFHLFVVRVRDRDHFRDYLKEKEIGTLVHYPVPPHRQGAFPHLAHLSFPVSEQIHDEVVSIPINPILETDQINRIINALNNY
ncbi:MAG: DegT/DnrJ/EryC1/StrS family aminotransferase [Flavobacteriaceae bacterium]|nr:DegT/DnrJ/EryC1/StrS family aminotransferase [Flavobacteriaceae bacterium]